MIAWYFKWLFLDVKDDVFELGVKKFNPFKGEYIIYFF